MNIKKVIAVLKGLMALGKKFFFLLFPSFFFFSCFVLGNYYSFFGLRVNDFLFLVGIFTFFFSFLTGIVRTLEAKVRSICYVGGLILEFLLLKKTGENTAIFTIFSLSLRKGFLYSMIGSIIFRFFQVFTPTFIRYPSFSFSIPFAIGIYGSFIFSHTSYSYIFFYLSVFFCILLAQRSFVKLTIHKKNIILPLYLLLLLGGIGIRSLASIFYFIPPLRFFYYQDNTRIFHILYHLPVGFLLFFLILTLIVFMNHKEKEKETYNIVGKKDIFGKVIDLHVAFAGGGTGGHVRPIESLIKRRKKQNLATNKNSLQTTSLYRFGQKNSFEENTAQTLQKENIPLTFIRIYSGKFRREKTIDAFFKNIRDIFLFFVGFLQALRYIFYYKIDVVFCKGGYVALPVVVAGFFLGKKIIVHESDAHPGLTNMLASYIARDVFTGFPDVLPKGIYIGQILSDELLEEYPQSNEKEYLSDGKKGETFASTLNTSGRFSNILLTGGSLGAKTLYEAIAYILENSQLLRLCQIVLIGGLLQNDSINSLFEKYQNVKIIPFATQSIMGNLYERADICVTRAGATTLAEASLFGCKCLVIPIPWTHDQKQNAIWYAQNYGGMVFDQEASDFIAILQRALEENVFYKKKKQEKFLLHQQITTPKEYVWRKILNQERITF